MENIIDLKITEVNKTFTKNFYDYLIGTKTTVYIYDYKELITLIKDFFRTKNTESDYGEFLDCIQTTLTTALKKDEIVVGSVIYIYLKDIITLEIEVNDYRFLVNVDDIRKELNEYILNVSDTIATYIGLSMICDNVQKKKSS